MSSSNYADADYTKFTAITHWVMTVILAAAAAWTSSLLTWPWILDFHHPDFNPMVALPLLLGAVAVRELFEAVRWTLRQRRFGTSTMVLKASGSVRMGQVLEGQVRTALPLQAEGDILVVLKCVETHQFREMSQGGDRTHKNELFTVWKEEARIAPAGLDTAQGIPFRFTLPKAAGAPIPPRAPAAPASGPYFKFKAGIMLPGFRRIWTTHDMPPIARTWQLDVSVPQPGTDFHAQFIVPVEQD